MKEGERMEEKKRGKTTQKSASAEEEIRWFTSGSCWEGINIRDGILNRERQWAELQRDFPAAQGKVER